MKEKLMTFSLRKAAIIALIPAIATGAEAGVIKGKLTDDQNEPLIGASIVVKGTGLGTVTDIDGNYEIEIPAGNHTVTITYIGYKPIEKQLNSIPENGEVVMDFVMENGIDDLDEVSVVAKVKRNTEIAQISAQKTSFVVQTGVSAQLIARTQDKDASEVIRRVPGVSIIDGKFIMVRGLSQRYNNVWLNGGAVPSSEADSRAFSFDILPSSQLENMVVVKSAAPEYPADFTGGFILVNTRQMTDTPSFNISLGAGINDRTHFRSFMASEGSGWDLLGFGKGWRSLHAGFGEPLIAYPGYENGQNPRLDPVANRFNNDWRLHKIHPLADMKLNASFSKTWRRDGGEQIGLLSTLNYSNGYTTLLNMENSLYGPYDTTNDKPVALRKATDNRWTNDVRLGAMLNLSFRPRDVRHYFEWKNIFNQISRDRYSERTGFNAQPDNINNMEYYYSSRTTYNTLFTGSHDPGPDHIDWNIGYAYANRDLPDRRLIERTDRTDHRMGIYRISREFTKLDENIFSAAVNYRRDFNIATIHPTLKAGVYGEYRTRKYRTRQFQYGWQPDNKLPEGFLFFDNLPETLLTDANYGPDKLYLYEEVNMLNDYDGSQTLAAGYLGINVPVSKFDIYAGVRYEYNRQVLGMNTRQYEESMHNTAYVNNDFFPSLNATYHIDDKNQLRLAYGRSVNRPEFRELSTSVYYDFDLGSNVMGNADLRPAYIDNLDLRYEWYPSAGEQISVALFYKHFSDPIEWTYTVAGGTDLIYSFVNAKGANNYGVELDIRKNLDFIGLKDFSFSFNGALIKSKVQFEKGGNNIDRPMQGQSPYLINTGIFYNNAAHGWSAAVLYNRIGKRITGVGNRYGTGADGTSRNIPNSYEMPRNSLDLSVGKKFDNWDLKFAVRDVLAEKYIFMQTEEVEIGQEQRNIEEVTRSYRPGRNFSLTVSYSF